MKPNKKMIYVILGVIVLIIITFLNRKKAKEPVKYNDIEIPKSEVYNKASDNSVFQVENYLKSRHSTYRPLEWWPVQEIGVDEAKYSVWHRYRADRVVYKQLFFLDSMGNVAMVK
jgi:hypothetical protein